MSRPRHPYAFAVAIVMVSVVVKLFLGADVFLDRTPFLFSFATVVVVAVYCGARPGLLATVLAALASDYFFISPTGVFFASKDRLSLVRLTAFLFEGSLISLVAAALHASRRRALELQQSLSRELGQRTAAEELERAARVQIEIVLRNVADGITAQGLDGRLIFANDAAVRATGYESAEEMKSASPDDRLKGFDILREDGSPFPVDELPGRSALRTLFPQERRLWFRIRATGEIRASIVRSVPVIDARGVPTMVINVIHDITAERKAEEERERLLAAEKLAREASESARSRATFLAEAGAMLASSLDYHTTLRSLARLVVPQLADWCGVYMVEGALLLPVAIAHVDPEKVNAAIELAKRFPPEPTAAGGTPAIFRTGKSEILNGLGDEMWVAAATCPDHLALLRKLDLCGYMGVALLSRGAPIGVMIFASSESRRVYTHEDLAFAEEIARRAGLAIENAELFRDAQRANRMKDEFLATLSHELRTPLHAILGWVRMLRTDSLSETSRARALQTIERNANVQTQLVDDLLDVSRIITGKLRIESLPLDLHGVLEAALDAVRPAADAKKIAIDLELAMDAGTVRGDADRLQQVAWNLLSNAIKFTPVGGRVRVSLARGPAGDVEFAVRDSGKGILPEFLPYVFERFRQADSSTTREFGGLGLGLAIVRHLVELHGGDVDAESDGEGRGATFRVRLPVVAHAPRGVAAPVRISPGDRPLSGLKILVVDDEPDARELLVLALTSAGADVTGVASTADALEASLKSRPDAVVTDIGMPGQDGYELLSRLRRSNPTLPMIALTSYAGPADRQRAIEAGFTRHVAKPNDPAELVAVLCEIVSRPAARA